jgi:PST family polysaccharide transporter
MIIRPPPGRARLRWSALKDLLGVGGGQTAAGIANYFATQGDYMVVGRRLNAALLGVYTRAYELMRFPSVVFSNVAAGVLFSSFARLQDDPVRLGAAFRRVLFANAVILLPLSAGLIVLAPEGIRILMGPKWASAVLPFQIMATSILWRTTHKASAIVARSAGDVWAIAFWQAAYAVAVIGGAMVSVRWGIVGVSCTTAAAVFFHFTNLTRIALKRVSIGWWDVFTAHADGFILGILAAAGSLPVALALRPLGLHAAPIAIAATIAGCVLPGLFVLWRLRTKSEDWVWLLDRIKSIGKKKKKGKGKGKNNKQNLELEPVPDAE